MKSDTPSRKAHLLHLLQAKNPHLHKSTLSIAGLLVTLGIIYGDIGTSPLYVMKAIIGDISTVNANFIYGAISCVIWTLTLQTTVKYVLITIRADNKGEGGIFSLFALMRKKRKWLYIFAIVGGSTLLADGIITPSITVVSAIEGLKLVNPDIAVIPIVLIIITALFAIQQFGTDVIGKSFGPIMFIWFSTLGVLGLNQIIAHHEILRSFNPYYAYDFLTNHPSGFLLLGAIFLCTTGAEALYTDLGHCGIKNIRTTWFFVKTCLVLNYLGQGAWIINNISELHSTTNPFYSSMPAWFLLPGIILATAAAIIASQALITGSYTLISEAISLNFWPKVKIKYPTHHKGQMYISSVNWLLWVSCCIVILIFQESTKMEAAYGLSITITMLMTTILLGYYLFFKHVSKVVLISFLCVYLIIEGSFLIANMHKFQNGGWFTIVMAGILGIIMYSWHNGRRIRNRYLKFVKLENYYELLKDIHYDTSIPKFATNLVYVTRANYNTDVETKIIYSLVNKQPKRADLYWILHLDIVDEPHTADYKITVLIPNVLVRIDFYLGFKVEPKINLFFKQVVNDMARNNELDVLSRYQSLRKHNIQGEFKFVIIDRIKNYDFDFKFFEKFTMTLYYIFKRIGITDVKALGLDTSNVLVEQVPLIMETECDFGLTRKY